MGKVIGKKIKGMGWTAKVGLVLLCTLLTSVFMYQGWLRPLQSQAAITVQQAWTSLYSGTSTPGTYSYTVNPGPNRTLVVGVSTVVTSSTGSQTCTVTYGGQNLTLATGNNGTSAQQHSYLFYLNEAGIAAATSTSLKVTVTGGTSAYSNVYAGVYNGVDQSALGGIGSYNGGTATSSTVGPLSPALTINGGDLALELINLTRTGSSSVRTISTWASNWASLISASGANGSNYAVQTYIAGDSTAGTNITSQHTASGTALRAMSAMVIKQAAGAPVIGAVSPSVTAGAGATTVTITGTGMTGATSVAVSGTLVSAGAPTVVDDGTVTVSVTADPAAAPGDRTITVVNGAGTSAPYTATGFVVSNNPAPAVTSVSPAVLGIGGTAQKVTIYGSNFMSGTGLSSNFGTGVTVNSTSYVSPTQLTANVTVTTSATAGLHNVTVTNPDTQTGSATGALTVNPRATVTLVAPAGIAQGASNVPVTITGTNFVAGAGLALTSSNSGITFSNPTVAGPTQITATASVTSGATLGASTVTVTNGDFGASTAGGSLTVYNPAAVFVSSVSPTTYSQGASNVVMTINGGNFQSGATVTFSSSRFVVAGTGTQTGPATFVNPNQLTVLINTTTSSAASTNVTITNPDSTSFTLNAAAATVTRPTITSVTPTAGLVGGSYSLSFVGTGFQNGATLAVTGTGATFSNVTWVSATSLTATLTLDPAASTGIQTITLTNPDNGFNTANFNVQSLTSPTLSSMTPSALGQGGSAVNVDVYGTNFDPAIASPAGLNFGSGVTTNSVSFVDPTHLTANVTLSTSANTGSHTVTVTNPSGEAGTGAILTVNSRPGSTSISPTYGTLGTSPNIAITSSGLAAGPGLGVTVSGSGITVNSVTLNSSTSVTANLTIDPDYLQAPLGTRTLTLSNGDYGVRTATFTVRGVAPSVTRATPSLRQGAVGQDVTVTGANFYPGATASFSNAGVVVNSTTFVDNNTLKANVTVSSAAATGTSNVTVTNSDSQAGTGTGIFSVAAGPTVASASPLQGGQGSTLDVTITGTNFDNGASASFSDTGITVNSTSYLSPTQVTANVTIAPDAMLTPRSATVTNPDGSSATGGSFTVIVPVTTSVGSLTFTRVTPTSITVTAGFTNDSDGDNGCAISWGTAVGSYPNLATATKGAAGYTATINGLTTGSEGEGIAYYFRATFSDPDGVVGNPTVTGIQATKGSDLIHNSQNLSSSKWPQGWGVAGGKYGAFNCSTCHLGRGVNGSLSGNAQLVADGIQAPSQENWSSSKGAVLSVVLHGKLGSDSAHPSSNAICEVCHSRTNHHLYNNPGANHMGDQPCTDCHSHNEGFMPTCTVCHAQGQNERRQVVGNGGDFFSNMTTHGNAGSVGSLSCLACHDTAQHRTISGGVSVLLKNADGGPSALYDGTSASASAVKDTCISCHDADGAKRMGTYSLTPFAGSKDLRTPVNIRQYWPASGGAHDTKMVCFNCHGNSKGVDGSTANPKYNGHASGTGHMLQDGAYNVANPNTYCSNCHNGSSSDPNRSSKNIAGQLALANKHVTARCFDCHGDENNSLDSLHSIKAGSQTPGSGMIANNIANATGRKLTWSATSWGGATGSTALASNTVSAEYQVCFKCHAATGTGTTPDVNNATYTGAGSLTNLALEFNPNNGSRHPVGTPLPAGQQLTAARLAGGWSPGDVMTCSDCHATDSAAAKGPHGSSVRWMLTGTNKAWPYTAASANGTGSGTYFRLASYNTNLGGVNGLFCMNCHTVRPTTGGNAWHINGDTAGGEHGGDNIMACASCHIRVPHGGKIARLLLTTNAPNRYRGNGNGGYAGGTNTFDSWGPNTTPGSVRGTSVSSSNFNSSCTRHNSATGEAW